MTADSLPEPLVPAEVDLRGLDWMELDVVRLMDSDMFALSTGDEFKAAVALWCKSFHQKPGGSLPDNDKVLAELSRAKSWKKVKAVALRGWFKCSDGRLYHKVVAEKALKAWPIRQAFEDRRTGDADRKARERADRKALFELLRGHGLVPDYDTKTSKLRELAKPYLSHPTDLPVTPASVTGHTPVTAKTGPDLTRPDQRESSLGKAAAAPPDDDDPPEANGQAPTVYGSIARQIRRAGFSTATPSALRFRTLVDAGATAEEFLAFKDRALAVSGDQFAYLVAAVEGERKRAAQTAPQLHRGPMPRTGNAPVDTATRNAEAKRLLGFENPSEKLPHA